MMHILQRLLLPALLALLTALPAAGMVLRPSADGALPAPSMASQLPDSAVQSSIFCGSGAWTDLPSSILPETCANDPVNWADPDGAFIQFIILGALIAMDAYALPSADNVLNGREFMTIKDLFRSNR